CFSCYLSSFLSCLLIHRPPCSSLFPYTTLFRSLHSRTKTVARVAAGNAVQEIRGRIHHVVAHQTDHPGVEPVLRLGKAPAESHGDRKSTRLNSSHGSISYAVFCLKKKIDTLFLQ